MSLKCKFLLLFAIQLIIALVKLVALMFTVCWCSFTRIGHWANIVARFGSSLRATAIVVLYARGHCAKLKKNNYLARMKLKFWIVTDKIRYFKGIRKKWFVLLFSFTNFEQIQANFLQISLDRVCPIPVPQPFGLPTNRKMCKNS